MSSVIRPSLEEIISKGYASSVMMRSPSLLLRELKMVEEKCLLPSRAWQISYSKNKGGGKRYASESKQALSKLYDTNEFELLGYVFSLEVGYVCSHAFFDSSRWLLLLN